MSGGEPSSIKRNAVCAVRVPDLSRLLLHRAYRIIQGKVCSLAKDRFLFSQKRRDGFCTKLCTGNTGRKPLTMWCGQPLITETLKTQVRTGRLSHAYLFIGTRGTGKTTCAQHSRQGASTASTPWTATPAASATPAAASTDGSVHRRGRAGRRIQQRRGQRPRMLRGGGDLLSDHACKKRVYIIDEVHMLSNTGAFNALLKILEEPPRASHVHPRNNGAPQSSAGDDPLPLPAPQLPAARRASTIAERLARRRGAGGHQSRRRTRHSFSAALADGGMRDAPFAARPVLRGGNGRHRGGAQRHGTRRNAPHAVHCGCRSRREYRGSARAV